MSDLKNNYVIVMAGGIGSRFWPFSRNSYPKQFHDMTGTGKTMLQQTFERFENICLKENMYIVTHENYNEICKNQIPWLKDEQILKEPIARNTAPCAAYAVSKISKQNKNAVIVVAPSDHLVLNSRKFEEDILVAFQVAAQNNVMLTLGIKPFRPDTGFGYIKFDE